MSIDSIVSLVAGRISELLAKEAKLLYGVEEQVRGLQDELEMMDSFLGDMEAMDEGGDKRSQTAIKQIRKLVYDAEDVIETYAFERNSPVDKTEAFFKRYVCLCSSLANTHQVGSQIEDINNRIVEAMDRWKRFGGPSGDIRIDAGAKRNGDDQATQQVAEAGPNQDRRPISYSHTEEEHVVGFEEDINNLVALLIADGTKIQMLSIVGMGGSGKTALARKLYNHDSIKRHFGCIAWVSISQKWRTRQILLQLLRKVSGNNTMKKDETCEIQVLIKELYQYLKGKKYLIVLDDVWEKKTLEEIFPALPKDEMSIIITTRKREVVDFPDLKCSSHEPRPLTEEEGWELFRKFALNNREQSNNSMDIGVLETLGKEMLKKCGGLPLAVIALAGILSKKVTLEEWEAVKRAVSSRIMEEGRGTYLYGPVNEMLTLSYNDLHRELKPCFLYLAMFQEDDEIPTRHLMKMWIAEGFITSGMCKEGKTLEDVAQNYLEELIDRCVVQIASTNYRGSVKSIRVHDLVRDLCIKKAKQQVFFKMFTSQSSDLSGSELRRTAIYCLDNKYLPLPTQSPHLRSLIYEVVDWDDFEGIQKLSLKNIHQNFRLLRVLNLTRVHTSGTLPTGIGSLIHLRYLGLRDTDVYKLPASIGNLCNLLTLECTQGLYSNKDMRNIPDVLWKIEGLKHLQLDCAHPIKGRVKLHTLKHLQTLKDIGGGSWVLEELPRLSTTVQKLKIRGISSEEQLKAIFRCPSITSDCLHSLGLEWNHHLRRGNVVMLENLQPISQCQHLRKLSLSGRMQDILRSCNQFPVSIMKLELVHTRLEEAELVALEKRLPNLMYLSLSVNAYVGATWTLMKDQFQQLKELYLSSLYKWEEWSIERGAMPQLSKLRILGCKLLRQLPEGLKSITTLEDLLLVSVGDELKKRAKGGIGDEGGEDAHIIQHVPQVLIT